VYDMYAMSAAHKTLPLPSFVRVTNLANNKSVVVRVNDRGPFHQSRIIDLSYSAAYKIGVYDTGTAKVKIEVLLPEQIAADNAQPRRFSVTVSGFASHLEAEESKKGLSLMLNETATQRLEQQEHKVVFGPYDSESKAKSLLDKVKSFGFSQAEIEASE